MAKDNTKATGTKATTPKITKADQAKIDRAARIASIQKMAQGNW